jgi:hypothetical protein
MKLARILELSGQPLTERADVPQDLGDCCTIKVGLEDADFWIVRRGSDKTVGQPTREYSREAIGVKVLRTDLLDPNYLYYLIQFLHSRGLFRQMARGTTTLVNIRVNDIARIPLRFS